MWNNIEALFEFKKINKALQDINESDILPLRKWDWFVLRFIGVFVFRWLIYLIAVAVIENLFVILVSIILGILRLYLSYSSLEKIKKAQRLDFSVLIGETLFVSVFMAYYFGFAIS